MSDPTFWPELEAARREYESTLERITAEHNSFYAATLLRGIEWAKAHSHDERLAFLRSRSE